MIHTNIEEEVFKSKSTINIISETNRKYIYKLVRESPYILKGYKFSLVTLDSSEAQELYSAILSQLGQVYRNFYLSKLDNVISPHFFAPLCLCTEYEYSKSAPEEATIYIEIVSEYNGEPLETYRIKDGLKLMQIYNWMRQSANALGILHSSGVSHIDISLGNMIYDEAKDILKLIDITNCGECSDFMKKLLQVKFKLTRDITLCYAPPEILQSYNNKELTEAPISHNSDFITCNIDVYCWGMCFYEILLKKNNKDLEEEIEKYKLGKAEDYDKFLVDMKAGLEALVPENEDETKVKMIIIEVLEGALKYDPKTRTSLQAIMENMQKFDVSQGIKLKYNTVEKNAQEKLNKMLGLKDFIDEQKEKINNVMTETEKVQDETNDFEGKVKMIKTQIEELEKEKSTMETEIEKEKVELDSITHQIDNINEKESLEKESHELEQQLAEAESKIKEVEKEIYEQTVSNESLFKRCEKYTELQIKYANDTRILFEEKEKLTKKLQETMKQRPPHQ